MGGQKRPHTDSNRGPPDAKNAPPPIIVRFRPISDPYNLTPKETDYMEKTYRKHECQRLRDMVRRFSTQHPEPIRIRVLRSSLPISVRSSIFNRLQENECEKYKEWVERALQLPLNCYSPLPEVSNRKFLKKAYTIMNTHVTGHHSVKREVLRTLCVWMRSKGKSSFTPIGIEGEPGIGKTTFVKNALAKCVDRPFFFISLGGASDAAYLHGHSFTYEGALHGRIAECLIDGQVMDPVLYFDELDKISATAKGDEITNMLIHLTDPAQNEHVRDRYFHGINLDLSKAFIVFSYNDEKRINPILLDRLKRLRMAAPSFEQKKEIVKKHLIPRIQLHMRFQMELSDEIITMVVNRHKEEPGLRSIEKSITHIISSFGLCETYGTGTVLGNTFDESVTLDFDFASKLIDELHPQKSNHMYSMYM